MLIQQQVALQCLLQGLRIWQQTSLLSSMPADSAAGSGEWSECRSSASDVNMQGI